MSLKQKTISGVAWSFAEAILIKGLSFVAMLLLARWLGPTDFGLIGMIAVFIAIGRSLVDSGMSLSIIRTTDADDSDFSTVFFMNMAMSFLVYAILFFAAPYIAIFYEQEILVEIIRVYCLSFIISAFSAVQLAILTKEMKFKRLVLLTAPSTIAGVVVGLTLGYYDYGVWSIVAMLLTTQVVLSILLWINASWKPSLNYSKKKFFYHYKFGYKIMLSGLLDTIFNNSYNVIIGKYFPVETLGFYERAKRFNDYPSVTITGIVRKVTYPMLAQLQNDVPRLSVIYRKMIKVAFFIVAPFMLGGAAIAKPLFELVLGASWLPAVPFFQVLSLAAILYPIHAFNVNILQVFGRSDWFLKLEVIKKILMAISIFVGFQFGIMGLIWSSVFSSVISLLINTHYSSRLIDYSTKNQLLDMLPILLSAGLIFFVMYFSAQLLNDYHQIAQITFASLTGILFYLLVHSFFRTSPLYALLTMIKNRKL